MPHVYVLIFFFLFTFFAHFSFAEYRVFRLQLRDQDSNILKEFESTLDPLQYPTYYPLPPETYLTYSDTWMCRGRTDQKKLCPNPNPVSAPPPPSAPEPSPTSLPQSFPP